jgi:3-oxoacyl-[acyl-carrier-protein] synthase III
MVAQHQQEAGGAVLPGRALRGSGLRVPVGIHAAAVYLPETIVTNDDLARHLDTSDEWIRQRTGITQRRFLEPGLTTSDMCVSAAAKAVAAAGIEPADVDAIVVATFTYDQPLPSTALIVKEGLGAHRAVPIDLNQAACAGGVMGLFVGSHLLQNTSLRYVLVIGAECLSRVTDPLDRATRVFFGDAAGAVVLGAVSPGHGVLSWDIGSALSYGVQIPAGGASMPTSAATLRERRHFLQMDGRLVWDMATTCLPSSISSAVALAGADLPDVRHFLIHQANRNIIAETMATLGVPLERAAVTVDRLGNTGAATVFTALHQAIAQRGVHRGDLLVISGIGAGFLWGSLCLRQH